MNFYVFAAKYPISAQFGKYFSRETGSGAGIACFCHSLVTSLQLWAAKEPRSCIKFNISTINSFVFNTWTLWQRYCGKFYVTTD